MPHSIDGRDLAEILQSLERAHQLIDRLDQAFITMGGYHRTQNVRVIEDLGLVRRWLANTIPARDLEQQIRESGEVKLISDDPLGPGSNYEAMAAELCALLGLDAASQVEDQGLPTDGMTRIKVVSEFLRTSF